MTLNPILALNDILEEYRGYLDTEFRARDETLRTALREAMARPTFLAQEPFYQAHRPFRPGRRWRELPLDPKLARVMEERTKEETAYGHQSDAIAELLSDKPRPVVVTTGTGSGKTEAFLLPVIQNAIDDASRFDRAGLTAILVYPMNALANDQELRIQDYLGKAGLSGAVKVARYDRGTKPAAREALRKSPPHLLLTNYMMLEYLLVRPADREAIFANHRCRFLVLDEVHTYRGTLGCHIAFLVRRLRAHLKGARQDWRIEGSAGERQRRFPDLVAVGTSATIKSFLAEAADPTAARTARDQAVQGFFGKLVGVEPATIRVMGEEVADLSIPAEASYPKESPRLDPPDVGEPESLHRTVCSLAGIGADRPLEEAVRRCRLLWDLNRWLIGAPLSVSGIVARLVRDVPERAGTPEDQLRREVETALVAGAALPDGMAGALRLRAHRFVRGGWQFHRCINPNCGRLHAMGEDRCTCGFATARLFLCRSCGADALRLVGDPDGGPLKVTGSAEQEWLLYEPARFAGTAEEGGEEEDGEEGQDEESGTGHGAHVVPGQMKGRPVRHGSLDPKTLLFSAKEEDYSLKVDLAPARTRCLCCGATAGSRNVLTPVSLGTSAALKVLTEGTLEALDRQAGTHDPEHKERILIFSDSRQDASHQARFLIFTSRYDRMRRHLVQLLKADRCLSLQRAVELLGERGTELRDNPFRPEDPEDRITEERRQRIRAWEEAPLLDDLAVSAGYRASVVNLGLVGVEYHGLADWVAEKGDALASRLGIGKAELLHVCQCFLEEMRRRSALSRELLRYYPDHASFPEVLRAAEWERRIKWPHGYAADAAGNPLGQMEAGAVPHGITRLNAWRKQGAGGKGPSLERILRHLMRRFGGTELDMEAMEEILLLLKRGAFLTPVDLFGYRKKVRLLQVNAEVVRLRLLTDVDRRRCDVCGLVMGGAETKMPCPRCHGVLGKWSDKQVQDSRSVRRILADHVLPLVAAEHTAQVPGEVREEREKEFKATASESPLNVLACSPTLEMGIDVGGLDAVALRNVPPRPDNYAQRGGRAGRRKRVGLVLGYARATPHDQYFYDHPEEMIAGEVPAPALALGNRDVLLRHVAAIAFGAAEPGLMARMAEYVNVQGTVEKDKVEALIAAVLERKGHALKLASNAFGSEVLHAAGLSEQDLEQHLDGLPIRIWDVFQRTARQVVELRQAVERFYQDLKDPGASHRASKLVLRLLGIPSRERDGGDEGDDRSAGYPLRRFAEFGILPGYEFPTLPAAVRLLGDPHEDDPVTVGRRFGIAQYQPEAQVFARTRRWKVIGLDTASPWNPRGDAPSWEFRPCPRCELSYRADHPRCPRCRDAAPGRPLPVYEFGGFLATRNENPVMDEEDRYASRNLVRPHPQWDGEVVGRWVVNDGWGLRLSRQEEVQWLNEGLPPTPTDLQQGTVLHPRAKGWLLCPSCGRQLKTVVTGKPGKGRKAPGTGTVADPHGHSASCPDRGKPARALAIGTNGRTEVLRLLVPVPPDLEPDEVRPWSLSLGYALRIGMRHLYMLDGSEIDFELEGPWTEGSGAEQHLRMALTFIDPSLGGTGYLRRMADEMHLVAARALQHLDHRDCERACYRCLKSYANQRFHELLSWPLAVPVLGALAAAPPVAMALETGDLHDPKPWLEAYAAGVGSPLELKFLRLFERHGFRPAKQVPVGPSQDGVAISVADFAVPEQRLAIYVDGASVHLGHQLRRDRWIRERLRNGSPPWRVEELRAADLAMGEKLIEQLTGGRPKLTGQKAP